ncbi:AMP-binding protein [Dethiobacter alkaliphilus]|uniref:AMP-dependent synthetase and ligase n=1 Tax=Dethiobacter alkaliphilus AHT 1 TaxID=555088 RepID=C0GGJ0_DETAL|nr:AMP-binding protein [Dethiobacter alkaliphilus]EEG77431.1 AMP-dependent synthetase and ligase [Dethiobacter alkaliphilus AHT 1]
MFVPKFNTTFGNLLDDTAAKYPDKDALVNVQKDLRYSYSELQDIVNQTAKAFIGLGVKKGDHVAIWATNVVEWVFALFGAAKIGAVVVTVNTNYRSHELEYLLKQSDSTTLFLIEEYRGNNYVDIVNEVCPELATAEPGKLDCEKLPYLKNVIYMGEKEFPGLFTWSAFLKQGENVSDQELASMQEACDPDDVINMQYTSGTTGFPKGVMLTHNNVINNAYYVGAAQDYTEKERLCIPVPFFHCFGLTMSITTCVVYGATMVPVEEFNPQWVLEAIDREKCTALQGVPTMWIAELDHPDFAKYDMSSLRTGIMAGSPCPIEVMRKVTDKMAPEVTIAYGQTESSPVVTQTRTDDELERRVSTVGRALPGVELKIFNPETGEECAHGVQGEICMRGYVVMKGYYKMPEATEKAVDKDGWLHSGDLGTMDEHGYVKITGRLKDMIIRGGENIYPREIEEFLYTNPKVLDVQVIGVPSEKYGEEVMAVIKLREGETSSTEEIREFSKGKIARHKIPKYVSFVDEYPMTASGKIQKYKLREMAIKELKLEDADSIVTA